MTNQEAFDKMWDHFVVQGNGPGWSDEFGQCVYRDPDTGAKCAVGCLLPDDLLDKIDQAGPSNGTNLKLHGIEDVCLALPEVRDFLAGLSEDFIIRAQDAHDHAVGPYFSSHMKGGLLNAAGLFGLTVPAAPVS